MFDYLEEIRKCDKEKRKALVKKKLSQMKYKNMLLTELSQIVRFINFPADLDVDTFNKIKIEEGMAGLYWDGNAFQCCSIEPIGLPRKDGRPEKVIAKYIDNQKVVVKSNLINDKDIVICYHNAFADEDLNVQWFTEMLTELDISMQACVRYSRYNPILRAKNDIEKKQLEKAMEKSENGEVGCFVSDELGAKLFDNGQEIVLNINDVKNSDRLQYLEHFYQGMLDRFHNLYGFDSANTGKMAQQTERELQGGRAQSWLLVVDQLRQAMAFCERFNNLYAEYIEKPLECRFGSVIMHNYEAFLADLEKNMSAAAADQTQTDEKMQENENELAEDTTDETTEDTTDETTEDTDEPIMHSDTEDLREELEEEINEGGEENEDN